MCFYYELEMQKQDWYTRRKMERSTGGCRREARRAERKGGASWGGSNGPGPLLHVFLPLCV